MDFLQALILSVVEGTTEFLPISSTGHLILAARVLSLAQSDFVKSFEIAIQLGAIAAVVVLYAKTLLRSVRLWAKILLAFVPTAIAGFLFYDFVKQVLLGSTTVTLVALFLGGIAFIVLERLFSPERQAIVKIDDLGYSSAFLIGICQSLSMIPGVSRSATTIFGGMGLRLDRKTATEFSFMLAIPTMGAATGLDLVKNGSTFDSSSYGLLAVGLVGSFVTAIFAIRLLLKYVQHHSFDYFGIYRIALATLFWLVIAR